VSAASVSFTPRGLREFLQCDPKLQGILLWLASQWPPIEMVVGSIYRNLEEEAAVGGVSGIHTAGPPYRAIDVHVSNLPGDHQIAADAAGALVNSKYAYDPMRPAKVVAYTKNHGTGPHIHLQVHAGTGWKV